MIDRQALVTEFHTAFRHPISEVPTVPDMEWRMLRVRMIAEELTELADAFGIELRIVEVKPVDDSKLDLIEAADALGDIEYLTMGTAVGMGIPSDKVFAAIHHSNMSKLDTNGLPVYRDDGKVLKGPNYVSPTEAIKAILS